MLGAPPTFVLSQDQTLQKIIFENYNLSLFYKRINSEIAQSTKVDFPAFKRGTTTQNAQFRAVKDICCYVPLGSVDRYHFVRKLLFRLQIIKSSSAYLLFDKHRRFL